MQHGALEQRVGFSGCLNDAELFDDEGWFRTGDVVIMDPGGRVTFISRLKDMRGQDRYLTGAPYVRFVTGWPMSGTKIKKVILREMIAADLKGKGITRVPKTEPAGRPSDCWRAVRWIPLTGGQ